MGGGGGGGERSKQLREASVNAEKEKVGQRETDCQGTRLHEENNGRRKRNQGKKQVGKLRRAFGIWRGGSRVSVWLLAAIAA